MRTTPEQPHDRPRLPRRKARVDLITLLQGASSGQVQTQGNGRMRGMMPGEVPSLKQRTPNQQITSIRLLRRHLQRAQQQLGLWRDDFDRWIGLSFR